MFRRSSKNSARTRKMTPQAMWRHMIREKKKRQEKEERSDNKKENKGEESERRPSPLWIDWELTHHAAFQPINLIDQSS